MTSLYNEISCVCTVVSIAVMKTLFSSCSDINECESGSLNDCDGNADCIDTIGSYNCSCINGYEGDGFNCTGYTVMCGTLYIAINVVPMLLICDLQSQLTSLSRY